MKNPRDQLVGWAKAVGFIIALDAFFVAIKLLGAFKDIGSGYGETLMSGLADKPLLGVLVGVLVTSVIQSSSTTTALAVGLTASGVFGDDPAAALQTAIPIIMGANVGTTVTNTIVSFGHVDDPREFRRAFAAATVHDMFNLMAVAVLLPLQVATNFLGAASNFLARSLDEAGGFQFVSPLRHVIHPQTELVSGIFDVQTAVDLSIVFALVAVVLWALGFLEKNRRDGKPSTPQTLFAALVISLVIVGIMEYHEAIFSKPTAMFVTGLGVLLAALWAMVRIMRTVVLDRLARLFHDYVFRTTARALLVGLVVTAFVQSSSVTTSMIVPLAGAGLLNLRQIFPYSLGANLGTTVTALLAALSLSDPTALAVALAHLLFNVTGIAIFLPLKKLPIAAAELLARGAERSGLIPVIYVVGIYVLLPVLLIWSFGEVG